MTLHEPPRFLLQPSPVGDVLIVAAATGIVELHPIEVPSRSPSSGWLCGPG